VMSLAAWGFFAEERFSRQPADAVSLPIERLSQMLIQT